VPGVNNINRLGWRTLPFPCPDDNRLFGAVANQGRALAARRPLERIGRLLGRDHTTLLAGRDRIIQLSQEDSLLVKLEASLLGVRT
jgi:hypothetical protein